MGSFLRPFVHARLRYFPAVHTVRIIEKPSYVKTHEEKSDNYFGGSVYFTRRQLEAFREMYNMRNDKKRVTDAFVNTVEHTNL